MGCIVRIEIKWLRREGVRSGFLGEVGGALLVD